MLKCKNAFCVILFCSLFLVGCRKAPSDSPKYYQSELEAMRREQQRQQTQPQGLSDRYPWQKKESQPCLSQRLTEMDRRYTNEIESLKTVVRGKKSRGLRLRD